MALVMIVFAGGVICADEFTYTVASKTSVTSTDAPSGVTATYQNTGTGTSGNDYECQVTKNQKATLTIKGLSGKITKLTFSLRRGNSSGAGTITVNLGENTIFTKKYAKSNLTSSFVEYSNDITNATESSEDLVIELACTTNSIYCKSFKITYEPTSTDNRTKTSLSFGEEYDGKTITKYIGDENIYSIPATLSPAIDGAEITYSSSNKSVAEVDNTGKVTLKAKSGTATITAEYAGNDDYAAATASYTIRIKNIGEEVTTFDFMQPTLYGKGESTTSSTAGDIQEGESLQSDDVYFTVTKQGDTNTRFWNDGLRLYKNVQFKINVKTGYHITNIVFTGANNFSADCGEYNSNSGKWEGDANAIVFTSTSSSTLKLKTATVTYVPDVTLTTAASSFATYAADYAVDYSAAGLDAYAITLDESKGTVAYNAIEGTTPAGTAVLVKGDASATYNLAPSTDKEATVTTALQISDGSVTAADNLYYGFATLNGVSGFKLVQNGVTIPAKKGYLKLSSADNAKTFYAFDGNTTGIEETFSKNEAEKALAPMYNISGQRVGEGYKGIVIVNGKKYVK